MARSARSPKPTRRACRPIRLPRCSRSARSTSRRCRIIPRRALSGGRASCASRAGLSRGRRAGAFKGVPADSISQFAYVSLRGREPAGEDKPIDFEEGSPDYYADIALAKLKGLLARFADEGTPYRSLVSPMWKMRYGDYDHL